MSNDPMERRKFWLKKQVDVKSESDKESDDDAELAEMKKKFDQQKENY